MNEIHMNERELDRLCWMLVSTRNRFYPPDETAKECIRSLQDNSRDHGSPEDDQIEHFEQESQEKEEIAYPDDFTRGDEHGYHRGMFTAYDEMIEKLYCYGINVLARANRYTHLNRQADIEFRLAEEPDYYRAVEGGAEYRALRNRKTEHMNPTTIETIDWDGTYTIQKTTET